MERIAAGPVPRVVVDLQRLAERLAPGHAEHAPGSDHVSGGVTGASAAEVDDRAEAASGHQQVGPQQVGVYPYRRPVPGGPGQRAFPGPEGRIAVDHVTRRPDGRARHLIELAQRPAPGPRCPGDRDLTQFGHE
jgi:hypothetical protein